jgi:hypothetical protein
MLKASQSFLKEVSAMTVRCVKIGAVKAALSSGVKEFPYILSTQWVPGKAAGAWR